ncbi:GntR family transcriptional regulator [Lonepinella koalarum]|uniref:GntR family transcriptional regulator n=1 Tax=Lonepinella koalarum TaxID=53417 RepID=UPI0011E3C208|nr:GntR family transcriptional regulator [Lonepinella koalarum]TYG34334.1 GntR family transcriptional regulator [Lonepinella koalarum]
MAKNLNLRLSTINQVIDDIIQKRLTSPLPSQTNLASFYNVSRTTITHVIDYLIKIGVIENADNQLNIVRLPTEEEKQPYVQTKKTNPNHLQRFENYLKMAIQKKKIKPNDELSEFELAKSAKVDIQTVREYFMQFSRFNLVKNISRGKWQLMQFDQYYADKLFEIRAILECHALSCFIRLPEKDIRWSEIKILYEEHQKLKYKIVEKYTDFALLDQKFHSLILSATDNPFINDFIELISIIFHFHYQWDNSNLKERNILAIEEHLYILTCILNKDYPNSIKGLKKHLVTAKRNLTERINQNSN